jgi:hypothetical protein
LPAYIISLFVSGGITMLSSKAVFWLRVSFIIGAVVDAVALVPMLIPWAAKIFWGFEDFSGMYHFAMGMGASLMLAWTILLLWAYRKPIERRYIALFTIIILLSMIIMETFSVYNGYIQFNKIVVSLVLQIVWLVLFSYSFIISGKLKNETAAI